MSSSSSSSMQFSISTPKMAATSYCSSSLNHLLTSLPNFHRHPPSLSFLSPNSRPCPFLQKGCSSILTASLTGRSCGVARASLKMEEEPMVPPYNVLITGSTKGIGYALAKEFLKAGDNVLICSRSVERVEATVEKLREEFGKDHVWGTRCDVKEGQDVKNLVAFAQEKMKYIDIWINNAGSNAYSYKPLAESSDEDLIEVVTTNTLGLMICCREAIKMMLNQPRGGHIFNMDGAGSDGRPTPRFAAYGATKRSVVHLTKSLQAELQMQDVRNVLVHNLSPGMVTTDLLMSGANTKQAKFFINVLAEPADVVAEYIVPSIRSVPANGSTKPTYIRFLTGIKAYTKIFSVKPQPFASVFTFIMNESNLMLVSPFFLSDNRELHLVQEETGLWLKSEIWHWRNFYVLAQTSLVVISAKTILYAQKVKTKDDPIL